MKVIFLDIDGVVNCQDTFFKTKGDRTSPFLIDPYMALLVARIVQSVDCQIVLSSSWRHHPDGIKVVEKRVWKISGITPTIHSTPEQYRECTEKGLSWATLCERGKEIKQWLSERPEVTRYAILDDENDMLPEQQSNFFKTSWKTGLTDEIAQKVIEHLF